MKDQKDQQISKKLEEILKEHSQRVKIESYID
jgi:hypothetical protein